MKRFFMITVFTLFASGMMYAGTANQWKTTRPNKS